MNPYAGVHRTERDLRPNGRIPAAQPEIPRIARVYRWPTGAARRTGPAVTRACRSCIGRAIRVYRSVYRSVTGGVTQGQDDDDSRVSHRYTLGPTIAGPRLTAKGREKVGHRAPWHHQHHRCVGCGTQGRPGRSDSRFALYERSGDRRRGTRRIGAATAIEWPAVRSALREAVPDEVRAGSAGAPAQVLGEVHRHATGSASAARSARENDGAAATSLARKETDRATGVTRPAMRSGQAARMTGMPSCLALSTRFSVMPLPGKAMTPFGRRFSSSSLRRNGAARPWRSQSGLQTTKLTSE